MANLKWTVPEADLLAIEGSLSQELSRLKNKKVLIAGGTGFIGSWLSEALCFLSERHQLSLEVTVMGRNRARFSKRFKGLEHLENFRFECAKIESLKAVNKNYDFIVHAAFDPTLQTDLNSGQATFADSLEGTQNLLDIAAGMNRPAFLFLSSGAVYDVRLLGQASSFTEEAALLPGAPLGYGESKVASENICKKFAEEGKVDLKIIRCFSLIGPWMPLTEHFAAGNFINNVLQKTNIVIKSDGSAVRSYLYIADACTWLLKILLNPAQSIIYNLGSDKAISILNLAKTMIALQPEIGLEIQNGNSNGLAPNRYLPSTQKTRDEFKLIESITLSQAIQKTISWNKYFDSGSLEPFQN